MFRYERPQTGRNRQFHQFGLEAFGSVDPLLYAEVIALGMRFFASAGLRNVKVQLNSVVDPKSRAAYFEKLILRRNGQDVGLFLIFQAHSLTAVTALYGIIRYPFDGQACLKGTLQHLMRQLGFSAKSHFSGTPAF
jgi:ATP phosphoribosyltransferase regulatory subunit HisZ